MTAKICKNCKYYQERHRDMTADFSICKHPHYKDLIDGEYRTRCLNARAKYNYDPNGCGSEGRLYEEMDK